MISDPYCASLGENCRCSACRASLLSAPASEKNTASTRPSRSSARSSASTVLAKLGASGFSAIRAISARASAIVVSNASSKWPSSIRSKGGISNSVSQLSSNGLVIAGGSCQVGCRET